MPVIRISEKQQSETGDFSVAVSFNNSIFFDGLTVGNPLSPQNGEMLEWHFEHFVSYPFLSDVKPEEAEKIIREEGENLFSQIFSQNDIYLHYRESIKDGFDKLVVEISGSPEFHSLHWESLKDPNFPKPIALDALILRQDLKPQNLPAVVRKTSTINLLIVTSRPHGERDVGYRTISRPLVELLRNAQLPVKVHILRPATYKSLDEHLNEVGIGFYHAVHFDVHGALLTFENFEYIEKQKAGNNLTFQITRWGRRAIQPYAGKDAFLFFDLYQESESKDEDGFHADPVRADELADLLLDHGVPLIILNACQSAKETGNQKDGGSLENFASETSLASRLMEAGAQMVLAMSYSVTVTAAQILMEKLYKEIFHGKNLHQAIKAGRRELANDKRRRAAYNSFITLEDWLLPVVYQKQNVELKTEKISGKEEETLLIWREEIGRMPEVEYGFHGRDVDILNIERRILLKNNILLIRGMGGAGKTTLLRHLAWWWRATDFIEKIFYFGYDEKAYTRQEIMLRIAENFYDKFELANFQALDEKAQMQKLALKLRNERHLLILDNLESIQGGKFAIKHKLSGKEQEKLKEFLAELRGTDDPFQPQTIVLLGSRGAEEWLADRTFRQNLYDLGGLDRESATQFAEEILRQTDRLHYRNENDFKKLLKLLAGFPLPMKVIFENLKRQTPTEILAALRAGNVDLNTGTAEEKTSDILKCIEYSHRNIAPEKQELLLCLAPFTSVVNRMYFDQYIEELKKHPALAHLKHDLWDEVFAESIERGLMSQQEELPIFHLQPILPYFLKTEWQKTERVEFKKAVQTAFRDYYDNVSGLINQLMDSKKADEKMFGQSLVSLEFENIDTCLEYSLITQTSILSSYLALLKYYDTIQNHQAILTMGEKVLKRMERYPTEILAGVTGAEFAGILDSIAKSLLDVKKYAEAEISYQKVLELLFANQSLDDKQKKQLSATIYHQLGYVAADQREFEKAESYYKQALEIKIEFNDRYSQAKTFHHLGIVAQEQREYEKAEDYYKQALEIKIEFNDRYSQALTFHNLGKIAQEQHKYEKAEDYYKKALEIYIEFNDRYSQALTFHNLGVIAQNQQEYEKAEDYYKQALEIYIEFNNRYSQAGTFHQLGSVAQNQREYEKAKDYYKQALEINIEFNDRYSQASTFHQLGRVAQEQHKYEKAEDYYKQALEIKIEFNDRYAQASTFGQLGLLKREMKKFTEAQSYLLQTLEIFRDFNDKHNLLQTLSNLLNLWRESGDDSSLIKIGESLSMPETEVRELFEKWSNEDANENESAD